MEVGNLTAPVQRFTFVFCFAVLLWTVSTDSRADAAMPLISPMGNVILTVQGKIQNTNAAPAANFDMEMLKRLPTANISTHTPWTNGLIRFKGVLVTDLLHLVAANGTHVELTALNDYTVKIPLSDFDTFGTIIAYEMNTQPMSRRDKGPLWVIYPIDTHDNLQTPRYYDRMIWQLRTITVQ